jgi:pimeloyl-ACP methyl ester carboxylesterase
MVRWQISAPTLVIAVDRDAIHLEQTVQLFRALKNAELLIVPGTGHNTLGERPKWLNTMIESFLERASSPP